QELLEILINCRFDGLDLGGCDLNPVVKQIAQRRDSGARVGVDDSGIVGAAIAGADQTDRYSRVGLVTANRLWAQNGKRCGSGSPQKVASGKGRLWVHLRMSFQVD